MAVKEVIRLGHPNLRKVASKVSKEEILSPEMSVLLEDMYDTMKAMGGIGIAAPQIDISKQVTIIELPSNSERYPGIEASQRYYIFNPEIEILSHEDLQGNWEGCLSVPGIRGYVERSQHIRVNFLDKKAQPQSIELHGFLAIVFQHEIDHLFGKVFIDRVKDTTKLSYTEEWLQFWVNEN